MRVALSGYLLQSPCVEGRRGPLAACSDAWRAGSCSEGAVPQSCLGEQRGRGGFVPFKDMRFAGGAHPQKDKGLKQQGDGREP